MLWCSIIYVTNQAQVSHFLFGYIERTKRLFLKCLYKREIACFRSPDTITLGLKLFKNLLWSSTPLTDLSMITRSSNRRQRLTGLVVSRLSMQIWWVNTTSGKMYGKEPTKCYQSNFHGVVWVTQAFVCVRNLCLHEFRETLLLTEKKKLWNHGVTEKHWGIDSVQEWCQRKVSRMKLMKIDASQVKIRGKPILKSQSRSNRWVMHVQGLTLRRITDPGWNKNWNVSSARRISSRAYAPKGGPSIVEKSPRKRTAYRREFWSNAFAPSPRCRWSDTNQIYQSIRCSCRLNCYVATCPGIICQIMRDRRRFRGRKASLGKDTRELGRWKKSVRSNNGGVGSSNCNAIAKVSSFVRWEDIVFDESIEGSERGRVSWSPYLKRPQNVW